MRPKENKSKLSTSLREAGFTHHPSLIARIKASRRLKTANTHLQEALDLGAAAAALSPVEREVTAAAAQVEILGRAHTAAQRHDARPAPAAPLPPPYPPVSPEDFARLHSEKITAQSLHQEQARGVRSAKRHADYARLMLSRALDNFGAFARHEEHEALKAAIDYESECSAALTEAHKEHVASIDALNRAQEAYLAAIHRAPREALAARLAAAINRPFAKRHADKHDTWPDDAALEQLRWIPTLGADSTADDGNDF